MSSSTLISFVDITKQCKNTSQELGCTAVQKRNENIQTFLPLMPMFALKIGKYPLVSYCLYKVIINPDNTPNNVTMRFTSFKE